MNNNNFNPTSLVIFKLMQSQAKNNIKTPLGLISLMIQLNHGHDLQLEKQEKHTEMEL